MKPIYTCPNCNADLTGELIPVERRQLFDGAERYSREVFTYLGHDMATYSCPNCAAATRDPFSI